MAKVVAGRGSVVNPKVPSNRNASGYSPEEDINQGPSGAPKRKVSGGHGQNSDGPGHDDLMPLSPMQFDPYKTRGEDFPVKEVSEDHGQDESGAATWESRNGGGKNMLAAQAENQCSPRHVEDDGPGAGSGTPVPGNRGTKVAAAFPIDINKGESNEEGGEISIPESVNLQTGYLEVSGVSPTPVDETPARGLTIGSSTSKSPANRKR